MGRRPEWKETFYLLAFKLARAGESDQVIAGALGVSPPTFQGWMRKKPAFAEAIAEGREMHGKRSAGVEEYKRFVVGTLRGETLALWDAIHSEDPEERACGVKELEEADRRTKQQIFIHALIANNFKTTLALKTADIRPSTYTLWRQKDRRFAALMVAVREAKKDFFEGALIDLVALREPSIVKFVNQTYNADRGYAKSVNHKIEGKVDHEHKVDVSSLSVETRRKMVEEYRAAQEGRLLEDRTGVAEIIDVEVEKEAS